MAFKRFVIFDWEDELVLRNLQEFVFDLLLVELPGEGEDVFLEGQHGDVFGLQY